MWHCSALLLLLLLPASSGSTDDCTISVSPGSATALQAALAAAVAAASAASPGLDTVVCLAPGTYSSGLTLTPADTPANGGRIIWRSTTPGAAVISGGTRLTGWRTGSYAGSPAVYASLPPGVPAAGDAVHVRQLWVGGLRAARAGGAAEALLGRLTATRSAAGTTLTSATPLPPWLLNATAADPGALSALEFSWPIVVKNWIAPRCTVAAASASARSLTLVEPCGALLWQRAGGKLAPPVAVEALPGAPLQPGTFYHAPGARTVFYALAPGQSLASVEASAVTAFTETLLTALPGTARHAFQGLAFSHTTWAQPNAPDGFVGAQSSVFTCTPATAGCSGGQAEPRGAVELAGVAAFELTGCTFTAIGSAWGLSLDRGSSGSSVRACTFSDLSGGFLKLGSVDAAYAGSPNASLWDRDSVVADNVATGMAVEIEDAAGLFGGYLHNASIEHNYVAESGYDGISVGWGWGATGPLPGHGGNNITGNSLHSVMNKLRDGGGIYVNGKTQPAVESLIQGNYVNGDAAVFAVIYIDNGGSHYKVANNVVVNGSLAWAFFMQGCCNLPAYNSSVSEFYWEQPMLAWENNCAQHGCTVDAATVYELQKGQALPPKAQAIVDASGPRAAVRAAAARGEWA